MNFKYVSANLDLKYFTDIPNGSFFSHKNYLDCVDEDGKYFPYLKLPGNKAFDWEFSDRLLESIDFNLNKEYVILVPQNILQVSPEIQK